MMAKQSVIGFVTNVTEESSSLKDRPEWQQGQPFYYHYKSLKRKKV